MDDAGNVTAWDIDFFIPQAGPELNVGAGGGLDLAGMPTATVSFPGNIFQRSAIPYKFPNVKTVCKRLETTPLRPSWIRTPGRMQNTYANECFIDELAAAAKRRPARIPPEVSRPRRQARARGARPAWRRSPSGRSAHRRKKTASGNVVKGTRRQLRQIRAGAHLCRRRGRGRSGPLRPA